MSAPEGNQLTCWEILEEREKLRDAIKKALALETYLDPGVSTRFFLLEKYVFNATQSPDTLFTLFPRNN